MKECQVCYEEKHKREFKEKYSSRCEHEDRNICDACVYQSVAHAFSEFFNGKVRCPEEDCDILLREKKIRKILSNNDDRELLEKYDEFLLYEKLQTMKEFIWCAHGCGSGQLNKNPKRNNIVECIKCYKETCFKHKTRWHEGLTCEEYDSIEKPDDRATKRWIRKYCEKCPECSAPIRKAHGCDHITCANCKHEFCWSCLANYKKIEKHGNHRHKSSCKHYSTDSDSD